MIDNVDKYDIKVKFNNHIENFKAVEAYVKNGTILYILHSNGAERYIPMTDICGWSKDVIGYDNDNLVPITGSTTKVSIDWFDGHTEEYNAIEVEDSGSELHIVMNDFTHKHIPLYKVKSYTTNTEYMHIEC